MKTSSFWIFHVNLYNKYLKKKELQINKRKQLKTLYSSPSKIFPSSFLQLSQMSFDIGKIGLKLI